MRTSWNMAFNGSKNFSENDVIRLVFEDAGANFGADINAFTSYEETVYQLKICQITSNCSLP
ncbi:insulinase family protein [Vibrio lentus]|nr:insulinase family protein [Vibrio lentus]